MKRDITHRSQTGAGQGTVDCRQTWRSLEPARLALAVPAGHLGPAIDLRIRGSASDADRIYMTKRRPRGIRPVPHSAFDATGLCPGSRRCPSPSRVAGGPTALSRRRGRLHPLLGRSRQPVLRAGLSPLRARPLMVISNKPFGARGIPRGHGGRRNVRSWLRCAPGERPWMSRPRWTGRRLERLRLGVASTVPNWQTPGGVRSHHESNSALGARGDPRSRGHHYARPGTMDPWDRLDPGGSPGRAWRRICLPEWATRKVVSV